MTYRQSQSGKSPAMTNNYTNVVMTNFDDVVKFQERMYEKKGKED